MFKLRASGNHRTVKGLADRHSRQPRDLVGLIAFAHAVGRALSLVLMLVAIDPLAAAASPTLSKVSAAPAGYGTVTLSIKGTGFDQSAQVAVSGSPFTVHLVSSKKLTAKGTIQPIPGNIVPVVVAVSGQTPSAVYPLQLVGVKNAKSSYRAAFRLLEQASWGPDPQSIADVQKVGMSDWIEDQLAVAATSIAAPPDGAPVSYEMTQFLSGALQAPDQLRERVSFALGEIFVVSSNKTDTAGMVAYFNLLQQDAFVNFRQVIADVTLSPAMGNYLDMVNNARASGMSAPNENYAREVMQLFSIGTIALNADATPRLDASGNTIANYGESDIQQLTHAFTGWTYAPLLSQGSHFYNPPNWAVPMIALESYHDKSAKTFLGQTIPAGELATQDVQSALDIIFNHPNVGPFIALRLIQHLVTSNPSSAYVKRIAAIFDNNGHHVRGDLAAVVKAILLDREARAGDKAQAAALSGHLREPVLYALELLRAVGASVGPNNALQYYINNMGQLLFIPASVFNYYSPLYRINDGALGAPEFQTLSPSTAVIRANFIDYLTRNLLGTDTNIDLSPFAALAANPDALIDAVGNALFGGAMPASMRATIAGAIAAEPNLINQARNAFYLAASSGLYQVEH